MENQKGRSHQVRNRKTYFVLLLSFLSIYGCFIKSESEQYKQLKRAYEADPKNPEVLQSLILSELLEQNNTKKAVELYETNADVLSNWIMARVYYATALCRMAGESDNPSKQLKYVRQGMHEFELLREKWPDDGRIYIWQAITYSNFPEMLGAAQMVTETIELVNKNIMSNKWSFVTAELRQLVFAYINLAKEYKNVSYLHAAEEQAANTGLMDDEEIKKAIAMAKKGIK
jgi:tetratricopeptide (TPR) repeat protein